MEATKRPFRAAAPDNPKTNAADKEREKQICSKRKPRSGPIDRLGFEVPQVAAKEERSVLWYASDGLSGEMGCLGKSDD